MYGHQSRAALLWVGQEIADHGSSAPRSSRFDNLTAVTIGSQSVTPPIPATPTRHLLERARRRGELIRSAAEPEREEGTRVRFRGTMYQLETGGSTRVECGLYIRAALG